MKASTYTAGAFDAPLNVKSLDDIKKELAKLNKNSDWLLVNPNGQMYRGSPQDMMRVLIPFHPIIMRAD